MARNLKQCKDNVQLGAAGSGPVRVRPGWSGPSNRHAQLATHRCLWSGLRTSPAASVPGGEHPSDHGATSRAQGWLGGVPNRPWRPVAAVAAQSKDHIYQEILLASVPARIAAEECAAPGPVGVP